LVKPVVPVIIIDDSSLQKCEAACGVNWSLADSISLASQAIAKRFGKKAKLAYLDLSRPATNTKVEKYRELIKSKGLSLPSLLVNGEPRISGEFDIRQMLDAIEAAMEM
jgi:disulfide oxidoreductase YuzD